MKKLFFLATCLIASVAMFAATETFTWSPNCGNMVGDDYVCSTQHFTITLLKNSSSTATDASIAEMRCHQNKILRIEGKGIFAIQSITIAVTKDTKGQLESATITCTPNTATAAISTDNLTATFTGNPTSVDFLCNKQIRISTITFNYTEAAANTPSISAASVVDFGAVASDEAFEAKTLEVTAQNLTVAPTATLATGTDFEVTGDLTVTGGTLTITCTATEAGKYSDVLTIASGETTTTVTLTAIKLKAIEGNGTKENPYTVNDVIILNNTTSGKQWVIGYIIGSLKNSDIVTTEATNIVLAANDVKADKFDATQFVAVQLPGNTDVRTDLSIVAHPEYIGKQIKVYGDLVAYFSPNPGMKNTSEYEWITGTPTATIESETTVPAVRKVIENGQVYIIRDGVRYNALGAVVK